MNLTEAIEKRHSVRQYLNKPLENDVIAEINNEIDRCNAESGLHIQLVTNEPKAFDSFMAHYGKFSGVTNYIAMIGKKSPNLSEKCGYYGERLVLKAQQMGLNTCWVAMTYSKVKNAFVIDKGEKLCVIIAVGYGKTQGVPHKSKSIDEVIKAEGQIPQWFKKGVEAALLAPTAVNQQKFTFELKGSSVSVKAGLGFYTNTDMGIVKYHFEIGAGKENFKWADR
ncbi:MAG: nitroreductase family protein [Clostridia bacterium]|nr:nitroreductase family protein [Clostridia bacterium]